jgi:lysyl endopeptidase
MRPLPHAAFRLPRTCLALAGVVSMALSSTAFAQEPLGLTNDQALSVTDLPALQTDPVEIEAALARLQVKRPLDQPGPLEFAQPFAVDVTPESHGVWERLDLGARGSFWVWRLRVESPRALSVNLGFTLFDIPRGASLSVYAAGYRPGGDRSDIRYFTDRDVEAHRELWVPLVRGSQVVVELAVPEASRSQAALKLGWVNGAFLEVSQALLKSGSCNVDVVCSQGNAYRDQIRAVGVMQLNGSRLCTGSMINNTGARRPLFITANHCGMRANNAQTLVVYWNFQNSTCRPVGSPASGGNGNGSLSQFNSGSNFLATFGGSDVTLVELDDAPQAAFNVFLAGWDRRPGPFSDGAIGIHHPGVDEKRISHSNRATEDDGGTHHRVWWRPNGIGVTEPGSSGSPIYTKAGRFIGQLTGGGSACGVPDSSMWDVYGKLSRSWDGGGSASSRVRDHLDPAGTGATMIDGRNWNGGGPNPTPTPTATPTPTPSPGGGVQLFQHCNFGGWRATFNNNGNVSQAQLTAAGGVNNDASSIRIPAGRTVTLFTGNNQTGRSVTLTGDTACFVGINFNDVLSSMRIQ